MSTSQWQCQLMSNAENAVGMIEDGIQRHSIWIIRRRSCCTVFRWLPQSRFCKRCFFFQRLRLDYCETDVRIAETHAARLCFKPFHASSPPVTCPPSVITERVVSSYKELKANRRSSMNRDTINMHLRIALNSAATAHFDPRPAVVEFFKSKDRRIRETDQCLFQRREFVENFSNKT